MFDSAKRVCLTFCSCKNVSKLCWVGHLGVCLLIPELSSMVCDDFSGSSYVPVFAQHFLDEFYALFSSGFVTFNACRYFSA